MTSLDDLTARLVAAQAPVLRQVGRDPGEARALLDPARVLSLLQGAAEVLGPLGGRRLLEIGSGCGLGVALATRRYEADAWGVEPSTTGFAPVFEISREVLSRCGLAPHRVVPARGEYLPFPANSFDVVTSFYVLEHVSSVEGVLAEAVRVLRPGGKLYAVAPNYGSVWEGHYGLPWPPYASRRLASLYLRLIGRDPTFLAGLQLLTVKSLERSFGRLPNVRVHTLGCEEFKGRLREGRVSDLDSARQFGPLLRLVGRVPGAASALCSLEMWTPITVCAEKLA
jgi:SAM-dependent methyltransferase